MKPIILATLSLLSGSALANGFIQVDYSGGTYFKASTAQSSSLPSSQKCKIEKGDLMEYASLTYASGNHYKITLPRAYVGCGLTTGYVYAPHMTTDSTTLTVHTTTIFKKSTAQSGSLPAPSKCTLGRGFYKTSNNPSTVSGHYSVNFAQTPTGCGFSQGYVATVHANKGIKGMTLRSSAYLKKSTANSSTLPSSDKCLIAADDYLLKGDIDSSNDHVEVDLATNPAGCGFKSGYVYYFNTTFAQPGSGGGSTGGSYTWPQPGADLGSGWCVCRNIGTSPHIGQDFVQYGAKRAVAVQSGKIISSTFSSSCGYIMQLQDDNGGIWRYVHLNSPLVSNGSRVSQGQKLADISAYPRSGCGSGPHLHFERRSSGGFGDSSVGKSCQNGFRTCYYDPIKPWRNNLSAIANLHSEQQVSAQKTTAAIALPSAAKTVVNKGVCKLDQSLYATDTAKRINAYNLQRSNTINAQMSIADTGRASIIDIRISQLNNPQNTCSVGAGSDCIVSWSVVAQDDQGNLRRLFHDASVRNQALAREVAEGYCLPNGQTEKLIVLMDKASGEKVRIEQSINAL